MFRICSNGEQRRTGACAWAAATAPRRVQRAVGHVFEALSRRGQAAPRVVSDPNLHDIPVNLPFRVERGIAIAHGSSRHRRASPSATRRSTPQLRCIRIGASRYGMAVSGASTPFGFWLNLLAGVRSARQLAVTDGRRSLESVEKQRNG
jgi:hypothetical protein